MRNKTKNDLAIKYKNDINRKLRIRNDRCVILKITVPI